MTTRKTVRVSNTPRLSKAARDFLQAGVDKAGSINALGQFRGLTDGSWLWRLKNVKIQGSPSPVLIARLARYLDVDPFEAVLAFGHEELVFLLRPRSRR
jgi:hypothetical protein